MCPQLSCACCPCHSSSDKVLDYWKSASMRLIPLVSCAFESVHAQVALLWGSLSACCACRIRPTVWQRGGGPWRHCECCRECGAQALCKQNSPPLKLPLNTACRCGHMPPGCTLSSRDALLVACRRQHAILKEEPSAWCLQLSFFALSRGVYLEQWYSVMGDLQAGSPWKLLFSRKYRPEMLVSTLVAFFSQINVRQQKCLCQTMHAQYFN